MGQMRAKSSAAIVPAGQPNKQRNQFGTFGGVFTPSILTILGVIMFMRAGFVTAQAGIGGALLILAIAKGISILTALSICAISTNTAVRGGGSYFLISRVLGPEFGGAVGVSMFLAQALAVPFYILGFVEALTRTFPDLQPYYLALTVGTELLLFIITYIGADWAIRAQFVVMSVLGLAIAVFLGGAALAFDPELFRANWPAEYTAGFGFWVVFAIYFPAVTGMDAGLNMSGDLKDPAKSLPRGILSAVAAGCLVYLAQILLVGGANSRTALLEQPFDTLVEQALWGSGALVVAGVLAATLSSAMGSILGAPRILQALARDETFPFLNVFAAGARKGDEPRRALWLTLAIGLAVLVGAGGGEGGAALNFVAKIITMFFLCVYGLTNLAAFVESFSANPSFRPRFKYFNYLTALAGTIGTAFAAVLIDAGGAFVAVAVLAGLYLSVYRRMKATSYGDARRGFIFSRARNNLFQLDQMRDHPKNWRPTILVLSGAPESRRTLIMYAEWLAGNQGIATISQIIEGDFSDLCAVRQERLTKLRTFLKENDVHAFPEVVVARNFDDGLTVLLQAHSLSPIKANIALMGLPGDPARLPFVVRHLRAVQHLGMSILLLHDRGWPPARAAKRIDLWWRGEKNGSLMLILAHMLANNLDWQNARIRILRQISNPAELARAEAELRELAAVGRISADVRIIVSEQAFPSTLAAESHNASVVLLGMGSVCEAQLQQFIALIAQLTDRLPTTMFIHSSGHADLLA